MYVFGNIDISLPKEPSPEVGLWKMSTENLYISICMKVARTRRIRAAEWEEAMGLLQRKLEIGLLNEAPTYSRSLTIPYDVIKQTC